MDFTSVPIVTIEGRYLLRDGERFIIKGIVYQTSSRDGQPSDPLSEGNVDNIRRDVELFKDLGLNAILVYQIDLNQDHDVCMKILAAAGIYVVVGTSDQKHGAVIDRLQPRQSYNTQLQHHFQSVATCMARYRNTLGLSISNDLINEEVGRTGLVPETCKVLSQATLNLKRYMRNKSVECGQRVLPICIADTYWSLTHTDSFERLTRPSTEKEDPDALLDFYCVNHYTSTETIRPGSEERTSLPWNMIHTLPQFEDHAQNVPVVLSEYSSSGRNADRSRSFQETADLYSKQATEGTDRPMSDVLSGGFVYEFFEHENRYGLVKVDRESNAIEKLADYNTLKNRLDTIA